MSTTTTIPSRGLDGVIVAETSLSHVDGAAGRLVFRGHDAATLAEGNRFEAVWRLFYEGRLPTPAELTTYAAAIRQAGRLTPAEMAAVQRTATGEPLAALRTAISAVAAVRGLRPWLYRDPAEVRAEALALAAALPRIVIVTDAILRGRALPPEDPADSYTAAYLRGLHGRPAPAEQVRALDRYLALTIDHGLNASTFTARVVASTGADMGAVVVAALAALSGPLHGGAPAGVLEMLDQIAAPEQARDWLAGQVRAGRRIMGFGHRVYRTEDPRSRALKQVALALGGPRAHLALAVEQAAEAVLAELKPGRELHPNVEFWAAVIFEQCGIPRQLATATFCCSRVVGWTAHALEQIVDNRIMRPSAAYVGPLPPSRSPLPEQGSA